MTKPESPGSQITIIVDRKPVPPERAPSTGDALRDAPALPADRDLFLDGKDGDDVLIEGSVSLAAGLIRGRRSSHCTEAADHRGRCFGFLGHEENYASGVGASPTRCPSAGHPVDC